jgi:hypothetical protein
MPDVIDLVSRLVPGAPHLSLPFAGFLLLHVPAGLASVATGAVAAVSRKVAALISVLAAVALMRS